jgi:hypothetical protein
MALRPPDDPDILWVLCYGVDGALPYWKEASSVIGGGSFNLIVGNLVVTGTIDATGYLENGMPVYLEGDSAAHTGTPTAAAGTNAGTTPPVPIVAVASRDWRGSLTFGTGTGNGAQAGDHLVDVTFANPFDAAPTTIILMEANQITAALALYVNNISATGFSIGSNTNPAKGRPNTTYSVEFLVTP